MEDKRGREIVFLQDCLYSNAECPVKLQKESDLGIGETMEYIWHNPDVHEIIVEIVEQCL